MVSGRISSFLERAAGVRELSVTLELTGAKAETATYGAMLTLAGSGRHLAYSRLRVVDAAGRELPARMDVITSARLALHVTDTDAVYPIRIDPTFSDANWVSLNPGIPGTNGTVNATAVDGSGNLYIGGSFTFVGTVAANRIAEWNGTSWSALGSGDYRPALSTRWPSAALLFTLEGVSRPLAGYRPITSRDGMEPLGPGSARVHPTGLSTRWQ